jgi:hypothetical protein
VSEQTISNGPKYPNVKVKLIGKDSNAFFILGAVIAAMRKASIAEVEISTFRASAMKSDYDHLLATVTDWVTVY